MPHHTQVGEGERSRTVEGGGHYWRVYEATYPGVNRGRGSLIFDAETVVRRVRTYPADWFEASDSDLYNLSLRP